MRTKLRVAQKLAIAVALTVILVQGLGFLATKQHFESDIERLLSEGGALESAAFRHRLIKLGQRRGIALRAEDIRVEPTKALGEARVEVDYQLTFSVLFIDLPRTMHVSLEHELPG